MLLTDDQHVLLRLKWRANFKQRLNAYLHMITTTGPVDPLIAERSVDDGIRYQSTMFALSKAVDKMMLLVRPPICPFLPTSVDTARQRQPQRLVERHTQTLNPKPLNPPSASPDAKGRMYLVYLKYWTPKLIPLMVQPTVLFHPNFSIKVSVNLCGWDLNARLASPAGAYCCSRPLDAAACDAPSHLVDLA